MTYHAQAVLSFEPQDQTSKHERAYRRWRAQYPQAYALIVRFALEAARFRRKIGVKAIVERARWESYGYSDSEPYRFNNNYTSLIARDLIANYPELRAKIELRQLNSKTREQ